VRETEILVEQQPPQGVLLCDHAGLVINKFSLWRGGQALGRLWRGAITDKSDNRSYRAPTDKTDNDTTDNTILRGGQEAGPLNHHDDLVDSDQ